jgi:calcineurin-like phosphoesterase family protein
MMPRFVTSDWHLGEERMAIMGRPFRDGRECVEAMIANHNRLVSQSDDVFVLGDVLYQKADPGVWLPEVARFHGRKVLVRGNHDRGLSDEDFSPYFAEIVEDGGGFDLDADGIECFCTHYPTRGVGHVFNLVGHIHGAWKVQLNMLNVGVDAHHFRPVSLVDVAFWNRAVTEFYDEDVWVAYHDQNARWRGIRGKSGSYFSPQDGRTKE